MNRGAPKKKLDNIGDSHDASLRLADNKAGALRDEIFDIAKLLAVIFVENHFEEVCR